MTMAQKIAKRLREQRLDGITYKARGNDVLRRERGKKWQPINDALYAAIKNLIVMGY